MWSGSQAILEPAPSNALQSDLKWARYPNQRSSCLDRSLLGSHATKLPLSADRESTTCVHLSQSFEKSSTASHWPEACLHSC